MNNLYISYRDLSDAMDTISVGVMTLSADRKITSINRYAERITGCIGSELIGKDCREQFSNQLCGGMCRFYELLKAGAASVAGDIEITDSSEAPRHLTKIVSPLYSSERKIAGCVIFFQDHSAMKDLIERVRYEDRRMKRILDHLDIGVFTVDRGGHVNFFNRLAETITGYNREDIIGRPCAILYGKRKDPLLEETIADGTPRINEQGEMITREGRRIPVRANYMAIRHEDGRIIGGLATVSDLSLVYHFKSAIQERYTYYDMVGKAPIMQKLFDMIPVVGASDATVLIEGPTGTGKDVLARLIHSISPRSGRSMVKVNCAALPDNLLESEMFGYAKGAFTGADRDKPGRFQEADGSSIFLDEIGDLPFSLQAKLLRVLEDKEFYPLGSRKPVKADVRIISATNQGLEKLVKEKRFREDLYYRLNVIRLELPPLKDRKEDLPLLISHILKRLQMSRRSQDITVSEAAMEILLNLDYPGNIRELENILEHAAIICQGTVIEPRHLPQSIIKGTDAEQTCSDSELTPGLSDEKERILFTLRKYQGNKGETAKALNIDRSTLWRKMKKFGLV